MYCSIATGSFNRVHCVQIKEGDTGHSYSSLFKDYLDGNITKVEVLDPYIRSKHQVHVNMYTYVSVC